MENDLISVIVPVYNVEKYLDKCVQSIVDQTYTNLEIILVDDGSPDNCPQMCDEWAKKDNRIVVIHKKNGGLSDARNAGLDICKGEYISFIDSDDYINSQMIEKLYKTILRDDSNLTICAVYYVDEYGNSLENMEYELIDKIINQKEFWNMSLKHNLYDICGVVWNKLYRAEIFKDLTFKKGKIHEDVFIMHEIIDKCNKISIISEKLYYYVYRINSIKNEKITFRKFDLAEAFMERAIYFKDKKMYDFAYISILPSIAYMSKFFVQITMTNEQKHLYKDLKKSIIKTSYSILKQKFKFKVFIRTISFQISERFYNWQTKIYKRNL